MRMNSNSRLSFCALSFLGVTLVTLFGPPLGFAQHSSISLEDTTVAISKKRREIQFPNPIVVGAIRYEVVPGIVPGVFEEGGSVIAAYRDNDDTLLWSLKIYDVQRRASIETDKRTVLINSMALSEDGSALMIGNELGETYRLDLQRREVSKL
jgi:hypothetical protein